MIYDIRFNISFNHISYSRDHDIQTINLTFLVEREAGEKAYACNADAVKRVVINAVFIV